MLTNPSMIVPTQKAVNCLIDRNNNNNNNNNHNHGSGMRDTITNGSTTSSKLIKYQTTTTTTLMTTTIGTISSDPGILCFHHCNIKVFCFVLPHICPNCQTELDGHTMLAASSVNNNNNNKVIRISTTSTKLLPFRLPYPFVRASQTPCAIVLRPTIGDFLNDYNNTMDLHIAVTTSTGCVVEFDRCGLRRHRADNMSEWWQCLLVGDVPEPWYDYWDQVLTQICKQPSRWSVAHYNEDSHNCYAFVLAFLQALGYEKLSAAASSKTRFCEKFIVPRTTTAGKYISLYRKLKTAGIYMHPHPAQQQQQQKPLQHHHNNQSKTNVVGSTKNMLPVSTTTTTTTTTAAIKLPLHNRKHGNNNNNNQQQLQQQYNKMTTKTLTNKTKTITSSIIKRRSTLCTIQE